MKANMILESLENRNHDRKVQLDKFQNIEERMLPIF